ncbi:MAG: amidohydrolase family protein [Actinomycetota bacterium]|nr:amidohydrolase family protein [Actinomycetota bacterium]
MSKNYVVISTDCHAGGSHDQYREFLAKEWLDEYDAWRGAYRNPFRDLSGSKRYRNWDSDARISEMESDGIVAEVPFPNTVPPFFPSASFMAHAPKTRDEYDRRWAGLQAHNRWVADFVSKAPERRAGMAQILLNDVDDAVGEIRWAKEQGLRGGILLPGVADDSVLPKLWDPGYEPIWQVCEELDMPMNHHSGNGLPDYGKHPAGGVVWMMEIGFYAHRAFWHLIFSGVFQRHPGLKFVLAESGMGWLADELPMRDEMMRRISTGKVGELGFTDDQKLALLPSEIFARQCYVTASFMGRAECKRRHDVGLDRIMWASDYPHDEGTYPNSVDSLRNTFHDVPEDEVRKMLGETAAKLYGFDLDKLQEYADRVGPSPQLIATPLQKTA